MPKVSQRLIKPGDWIRYQHGGALIVAVVEYVSQREEYPYVIEYLTSAGHATTDGAVYEVRHNLNHQPNNVPSV